MGRPVDGGDDDLLRAQQHAQRNRGEIEDSDRCACFHCGAAFRPTAIVGWVRNDARREHDTARCPSCGFDAVLGSASGLRLTPEFLGRARRQWYRH